MCAGADLKRAMSAALMALDAELRATMPGLEVAPGTLILRLCYYYYHYCYC